MHKVWVFVDSPAEGRKATGPSAVFSCYESADTWITQNQLSGLLTPYVLDESAFDRSLRLGRVSEKDIARGHALKQVWTGGEEHCHYDHGRLEAPHTPTP